MRTKFYDLKKGIPSDVYKWCRFNNFHSGRKADGGCGRPGYNEGAIRGQLEDCRDDKNGYVLTVEEDGKLVAWALIYRGRTWSCKTHRATMQWYFQCYVMPRQRRRGIGTKMLKRATDKVGPVNVLSHDDAEKFFKENGMTKNERISGKKLKRKAA